MNPHLEKVLKLPLYQKALILLGLAVAIIAAFTWLLLLPKYNEFKGMVAENQKLDAKLLEDRRIASNLPRFKEEYEKMKARLDAALLELPNEKEIPNLLTNIASSAKENGLDVIRFKPGNETPKGFYAEVPVDLNLVGTFHEIAKFFYAVGDMSRIVNISNVNFSEAKLNDGRYLITINCLATTFRFISQGQQSPGGDKGAKKK